MRRGVWHQFGFNSQLLVLEQLQNGNGAGVILSPRDLPFPNVVKYSRNYKELGAELLIDQQFYNPQFHNERLKSYPMNDFRVSISQLGQINEYQLGKLAEELHLINGEIGSCAVLAPALVYEAGRNDIVDLNARLFSVSKKVGDYLGIPTYATIMVGRSASVSNMTITSLLSAATSLDSDGWYFGYEFNQNRIPSDLEDISRFGSALLTLACTGKPVIHSFAGPMSLLSFGFGATGAAIGHSQNLWQFSRGRWEPSTGGGGGGAPPRYFSGNLWGTFVYPDELFQEKLPIDLRNRLLTPTQFSSQINPIHPYSWDRWNANKHLLAIIGNIVNEISKNLNPLDCSGQAIQVLESATQLSREITECKIALKDETCSYQENWKKALIGAMDNLRNDYEYLLLLL